ncbi:MAG TPA: VanZ family protein [Rubrivivax sp.]
MSRQRSSAGPLAAVCLLLVVYASLYPFEGWRSPPGVAPRDLVSLTWPRYRTAFDDWSNLLGYAPLGALLAAAVARNGGRTLHALATGALLPALLAFALEVVQNFVPGRVPSLLDWLLNTGGAVGGSLLSLLAQRSGLFDRWQRVRERWFVPNSGGAIALLVLWPVALLFPPPVPLALGQVFDELRLMLEAVLEGTPWAGAVLESRVADTQMTAARLSALREGLAIALGLLSPSLVAVVVTRPGWRRWVMCGGALALAVAATTLSTALNFGPVHALAWMTPATLPALGAAAALACVLAFAGPRLAAALGLVCLTAGVAVLAGVASDPYYASSLQDWEQGRFIRFHGLAQWVGWLWPYAAMAWLLARLARRD